MININNRVDFTTSKSYAYNQNKPVQQAKTETGKEAAQKAAYTDEIAFAPAQSAESKTVKLSEKAQSYLAQLKEKYGDYDFVVSDFSTDDEASRLLNSGNGSVNVLITPDTLEKMAADEETAAYYENIISGAGTQIDEIKEKLGDNADSVKSFGFTVDDSGKVNYFALMKESFKTTDENGKETETDRVSSSFIDDLLAKVEEISQRRKDNEAKQEKLDKALPIPPKSFEKYHKDETPAVGKEKDYGNLPPESFEKFRDDEDKTTYPKKEDYGNIPPESFKKYQKAADRYSSEEDYGNLPPESFKKYQQDLDVKA